MIDRREGNWRRFIVLISKAFMNSHYLLVCFLVLLKHRLIPLDYRRISKNSQWVGNFVRSLLANHGSKELAHALRDRICPRRVRACPGRPFLLFMIFMDVHSPKNMVCHKLMPYLCHIYAIFMPWYVVGYSPIQLALSSHGPLGFMDVSTPRCSWIESVRWPPGSAWCFRRPRWGLPGPEISCKTSIFSEIFSDFFSLEGISMDLNC